MVKKLLILLVFLSLFLLGERINAQNELVHPYITKEVFKLREMSTSIRLFSMESYFGRTAINSLIKSPFQKQKYQKNNYPTYYYYMQNDHLLDKNISDLRKKPLNAKKICKEFIIGELFGLGGSLIGMSIGPAFAPKNEGLGTLSYVYIGWYFGYVIGVPLGVYIAGNDQYEEGSYLATLGGSILGGLIGVCTFFTLENKDIGAYLSLLCPPIGSLIGFNLSRKGRELVGNAFINYDSEQLKFVLGNINARYDDYHKLGVNINIIQVNF